MGGFDFNLPVPGRVGAPRTATRGHSPKLQIGARLLKGSMTSRRVLLAIAAVAVFAAVGTAAAASVVQAPVHAQAPLVGVFAQGVHTGQLPADQVMPAGHHSGGGCGGHHWGGW